MEKTFVVSGSECMDTAARLRPGLGWNCPRRFGEEVRGRQGRVQLPVSIESCIIGTAIPGSLEVPILLTKVCFTRSRRVYCRTRCFS